MEQGVAKYGPWAKCSLPPVLINYWNTDTLSCLCTHCLSPHLCQSLVVATEIIWPSKAKVFTIWPFATKVCQPLVFLFVEEKLKTSGKAGRNSGSLPEVCLVPILRVLGVWGMNDAYPFTNINLSALNFNVYHSWVRLPVTCAPLIPSTGCCVNREGQTARWYCSTRNNKVFVIICIFVKWSITLFALVTSH